MAYFLGRDCSVYITTEDTEAESYAGVPSQEPLDFTQLQEQQEL